MSADIKTSQMKLSQIRAFAAVAECNNFSEAALQLDVTQSAVSHAIASLESELGVQLFSRGRQGAALTPVGERLLVHAYQVLHLLEKMVEEANLEKNLHGGKVRIASFRSVSTHILPGIIARFRSRFPEITVTIAELFDYLHVEEALRHGRADLGFTYLPAADDLQTWEILRDDYIALLPPNCPVKGTCISFQELAAYPLITLVAGNACNDIVRNYVKASEFPINIAYEVREDSTIVSMVMQGLGATILPRLAAEPLPPSVRVYSLPIPFERIIGVAVVANALHTPAVFAFLDTVREVAKFPIKSVV